MTRDASPAARRAPPERAARREALDVCAECADSLLIDPHGERVRVCRARSTSGHRRSLLPPCVGGGVAAVQAQPSPSEVCFHCGCALGVELRPAPASPQTGSCDASLASTAESVVLDLDLDTGSDDGAACPVAGDCIADGFVDVCERERGLRELFLGFLDPVSVVRLSMTCRDLSAGLGGRPLDLLLLERPRWFGRADVARLLVSRQIRRRWLVQGLALDCGGAPLQDVLTVALEPLALRALALRGCGDAGLSGLQSCRWLLRLDLSFDALSDLAPLSALRDLTHLRLEGCERVRSVAPLARCAELRSLVLAGCRNVRSLHALAACERLEHLDVSLCFSLFASASALGTDAHAGSAHADGAHADAGPDEDGELSALRALRRLSLQGCSQLVRCPALPVALEELDMSACEQLLDLGGVGGCRHALRRASFASCDALASVDALRGCAALEAVDLSNCYNLLSVRPLSGCARLRSAQLGGCIRLRGAALGGCGALRLLNMTGCTALADVAELARCGALEHADLPFCTALKSVQPLVACARLQFLNLTRCDGIADVSCVGEMRALRELQIRWCPQISLDALKQLPAGLDVAYA